MKVYVVEPDAYPEDRYIFGIYSSKEIAERAIERYRHVAGTSWLNEDFVIKEIDVDSNVEFYGDKVFHFDRNGRYNGEYDGFGIVNEKFKPYVEKFGYNGYLVHVCVDSYDDDAYLDACKILEEYLGGKNG